MSVTKEDVSSMLNYDRDTGTFTWKHRDGVSNRWNGRFPGKRAGCVKTTDGYERIRIGKRLYMTHRLAWLMETGKWPAFEVDHIDGDRLNNRPDNLREATSRQNSANTSIRSDNTTGAKGVTKRPRPRPWCARIGIGYKTIVLGNFYTFEEAKSAYDKAAVTLFGDFAKTNEKISGAST